MIRRNTWILLIILAVLIGATFLLERNKSGSAAQAQPSATPQPRALIGAEGQISAISVTNEQGQTTAIKKENNQWTVVQPANSGIDVSTIQEAADQLGTMVVLSTINSSLPDESTGFAHPIYVFQVTLSSGAQQTLTVGKLTPTESGYYAQVNGGNPIVVEKYVVDSAAELLKAALPTPTPPSTAEPGSTPGVSATSTPSQ